MRTPELDIAMNILNLELCTNDQDQPKTVIHELCSFWNFDLLVEVMERHCQKRMQATPAINMHSWWMLIFSKFIKPNGCSFMRFISAKGNVNAIFLFDIMRKFWPLRAECDNAKQLKNMKWSGNMTTSISRTDRKKVCTIIF